MELLHESEWCLRSAGFATDRAVDLEGVIVFEDEAVLGFVRAYESATDIITRWRDDQDSFLRKYAVQLRRDPTKAWNIYSVLLTQAPIDTHTWDVLGIETDVHATRKIVRGGLLTRDDLLRALGPLLPLAISATFEPASSDLLLGAKLDVRERQLFERMGDKGADDASIAQWLIETSP